MKFLVNQHLQPLTAALSLLFSPLVMRFKNKFHVNNQPSIFNPGKNCWVTAKAQHARILIDCADFYRALHSAVVNAKRSIFILGWDIDSRTHLLRGAEEKQSTIPSVVVDLLSWKAKQNPDLQIYLLRWDSSIAFAGERELTAEYSWILQTPENISIQMDNTIPMPGSHHQKIIVIDDELVFTGGMDIARQRWDERDHRIHQPLREDVNGPYGPYHDVQIMLDGPIVKYFSELARERWFNAAGYEAVPLLESVFKISNEVATAWPNIFSPHFTDVKCAIARTLPKMYDSSEVQEIKHMYLDLIGSAQNFIYLENQFLTCTEIADALNKRLKDNPNLKVLIVSSFEPKGLFEREGMWAGRIEFKSHLEKDISNDRVRLTYTCWRESGGDIHYKRIHSKVMIIDDRYLTIASSNISNRSMSLDTECDLTINSESNEQKFKILNIRNDLIAEHTGRTIQQVQELFNQNASLNQLMNSDQFDQYVLKEIDDFKFTDRGLYPLAKVFADPDKPLLGTKNPVRNPRLSIVLGAAVLLVLLIVGYTFFKQYFLTVDRQLLQSYMENSRHSIWALPVVCLIYVAAGFFFFPVTMLSLAAAAVFGSILGPIYGMCGALASASVMFLIGRKTGLRKLRQLTGDRVKNVDHQLQRAGILGVAGLRLIPVAPFSLVNLAAGISSVSFFDFLVGSFIGFLPAFIAKGIVGDYLAQAFFHPTRQATFYLVLGLILWLGLIVASYFLARHWQKRRLNGIQNSHV